MSTADSNRASAPPVTALALQIIRVHYDPASHRLAVDPASVTVRPGDTVIWQFFGTPSNFYPWVRFDPADGQPLFGPFDALSQGGDGLWGKAQDRAGTFVYRAALQARFGDGRDDELAVVYSRRVELDVRAQLSASARPAHRVQVSPGAGDELLVTPSYVGIHSGEPIEWVFDASILSGQQPLMPRVQFTRYEGELKVEDLHYGPFTTLTYASDVDAQGGAGIVGTGTVRRPGIYRYRVLAVRESTGEVVWASSDDPVADDTGDPPQSGGGG